MSRGQDRAAKDKKMAADLVKRGIYHGRRMTQPYANSGGLTMTYDAGSTNHKRRQRHATPNRTATQVPRWRGR